MAMRAMSKSKLTKRLNKLIYEGNLEELRKTVESNKGLTRKCLAFLAKDSYRNIVRQYL